MKRVNWTVTRIDLVNNSRQQIVVKAVSERGARIVAQHKLGWRNPDRFFQLVNPGSEEGDAA